MDKKEANQQLNPTTTENKQTEIQVTPTSDFKESQISGDSSENVVLIKNQSTSIGKIQKHTFLLSRIYLFVFKDSDNVVFLLSFT